MLDNTKGQQWSFEVILALALFLAVFVFGLTFLALGNQDGRRTLELQNIALLQEIRGPNGFLENNRVNNERLNRWYNITRNEEDFEEFKTRLGLVNDFCIFFLDIDQQLVALRWNETANYTGLGDGAILLNDTPCGTMIQ